MARGAPSSPRNPADWHSRCRARRLPSSRARDGPRASSPCSSGTRPRRDSSRWTSTTGSRQVGRHTSRCAEASRRPRCHSGHAASTSAAMPGAAPGLRPWRDHGLEAWRQRLAGQPVQLGLGIECVDVARTTLHEQEDHASRVRRPGPGCQSAPSGPLDQAPPPGRVPASQVAPARRIRHRRAAATGAGLTAAADARLLPPGPRSAFQHEFPGLKQAFWPVLVNINEFI